MKKYINILSIIALGCLSSCYNGDNILQSNMIGELKTLAPTEYDVMISLKGDCGDMSPAYAFFQIGRSKDFSGQENLTISYKDNDLPKNYLNGTYYYRLCAISGNDTVFAPNVESFTINHSISMNDSQKVDGSSAYLSFTSDVESGNAVVMVSTDKEFMEYDVIRAYINGFNDGKFEYSATVEKLNPGETYYTKASIEMLLGTLESDLISFRTEDNTIRSIGIYGNGIDGEPIKDDLMVVIKNMTTKEWSNPYYAAYNETRKNYDILDFDYTVEPDTWYVAYAVTSAGTIWDNGYVVFGNGDYQYGAGQVPICWGIAEIDGSNPYIKMEIRPWTAQVRVEYPASWGQVDTKEYGLAISDRSKQLPGSLYDIESRKSYQDYGSYFGRPSEEAKLSDDGTKYSFSFNIFPTKLSSADCSMILYLVNDKKDVPCPDLDIQMGGKYFISFEENENELHVPVVTVKTWEDVDAGNITITPKQ